MLPTIRPMTTRQRILVDPDHACDYHLVSRCVRAGFLSGYDARTQRDYSYREKWVVQRLETLVRCFAVSLYGHSVKSDHFHLVVRYDPQGCHEWSDEEVARRWVDAFQPMGPGREMQRRRQKTYAATLADPARRERARRALGSLAAFMKHLRIAPPSYACLIPLRYCLKRNYHRPSAAKPTVSTATVTTNLQLFRIAFRPIGSMNP